mmetsp:Transcript_109721/g.211029  ORF Transcript_109721/g.211029 Transcript_109721/m.211029 type:complete len:265 (-) Transcript_109721:737-1531(-)
MHGHSCPVACQPSHRLELLKGDAPKFRSKVSLLGPSKLKMRAKILSGLLQRICLISAVMEGRNWTSWELSIPSPAQALCLNISKCTRFVDLPLTLAMVLQNGRHAPLPRFQCVPSIAMVLENGPHAPLNPPASLWTAYWVIHQVTNSKLGACDMKGIGLKCDLERWNLTSLRAHACSQMDSQPRSKNLSFELQWLEPDRGLLHSASGVQISSGRACRVDTRVGRRRKGGTGKLEMVQCIDPSDKRCPMELSSPSRKLRRGRSRL